MISKNYKEVDEILRKIKNSKKILLTSHTSPDLDSIGSILSFAGFLDSNNLDYQIILSDNVSENYSYLAKFKEIKTQEIAKTSLADFDLVIILDSTDLRRITKIPKAIVFPESIFVINIDHHITNSNFGNINLVENAGSTCEILFNLYKQWGLKLNKEIAQALFTGIAGDTGWFKYASVTGDTYRVASELVDIGANPDQVGLNFDRNIPLPNLKFWGKLIDKMEEKTVGSCKYVWSAMSYEEIKSLGGPEVTEGATEALTGIVKGTDFGLFVKEEEKGWIKGSFRARNKIDVSLAAQELGGGGHKAASGFKFSLNGTTFAEGVQKVHDIIKEKYGSN